MGKKYEIVDEVRYDLFRRMLPEAAPGSNPHTLTTTATLAALALRDAGIVREVEPPAPPYFGTIRVTNGIITKVEEGFDATKGEI